MLEPLVSVCMPAFNAGPYIKEAIQSIIDQTYKNWELIIVNDGSTDNTAVIIEELADERIKIFHQQNEGQCAAANKAFELSSGELIKFFDADDVLGRLTLEYQVKKLKNRDSDVASSRWGRFYNNDIGSFKLNEEAVWKDMESVDWLTESWKNSQPMMQCALWLIPRNIVSQSGLWDVRLSLINDFDFFTRILLGCNNVLFTQEAVLYYRSGLNNSLSGSKTRKAYESAYLSTEKGTSALLNRKSNAATQLICANMWKNFIYEVYPSCPDIVDKAERQIESLGGSNLSFPSGGATKFVSTIIGWKLTKKLKAILAR